MAVDRVSSVPFNFKTLQVHSFSHSYRGHGLFLVLNMCVCMCVLVIQNTREGGGGHYILLHIYSHRVHVPSREINQSFDLSMNVCDIHKGKSPLLWCLTHRPCRNRSCYSTGLVRTCVGAVLGKRTRVAIQIPQSYNVESELFESLLPIGNRAGRVDFL